MSSVFPRVTISKLSFSDDTEIQISEDAKIIIVGPNNSGKSQFLKDIRKIITSSMRDNNDTNVVKSYNLIRNMNSNEFQIYIRNNFELRNSTYNVKGVQIHSSYLDKFEDDRMESVGTFFCKYVGAEGRLEITKSQPVNQVGEPIVHPQQLLYHDDEILSKVDSLFFDAFSLNLMVDYRAGPSVNLHVGKSVIPKKNEDRISPSYLERLRAHPKLEVQGDGIRSYAGILFETIADEHSILLIDEPEAFLHPPQMLNIGKMLASEAKSQLFVATHSSHVLKGLLEGSDGKLRILRIQRRGDVNRVCETDPNIVRQLWEQPDLKYSTALEGIFHEQVIFCEDDSDCKLYQSVFNYLDKKQKKIPFPDTHFVPTGGKHAIPKLAKALRGLGVPTKAVFDLDFLSEKDTVQKAVIAFGGDWQEFEGDWRVVDAHVRSGNPPKNAIEIKNEINKIISDSECGHLPKREIKDALKNSSSWGQVKKYGSSRIPNGDATNAFERLRAKLENIGILVVAKGEAENFYPQQGGHGPNWVIDLLRSVKLSSSKLKDLREFTQKMRTLIDIA